ncbi:Neuronal acetylcholine receptor subunit beta-3 [Bulinus truncatus]|nr:Neuronal acetylcholine receptor subunit beta-3 [Bulinus truncatus]
MIPRRVQWTLLTFLSLTALLGDVNCQMYNDTMSILVTRLSKEVYHKDVRPLKDQSKVMYVAYQFYLESLAAINDVTQSFVCNGFLAMGWNDEMLAWNPEDFGGLGMVHPSLDDIWLPRVVLMNTLGDRDLFGDNRAPIYLFPNGHMYYVPGALFPTSCDLDLVKFPFDTQNCIIKLAALSQTVEELQFVHMDSNKVTLDFFIQHVEWDLVSTKVETLNFTSGPITFSVININFVLKRRPAFLLLSIILPVVFLSFLNILVFMIPAESGEKVGYGITVLLALTVFLSMVSTILPRSSKSLPRVTIYLFILLVISLLTVIDSIIIVFLHHLEEKEGKHLRAKQKYRNAAMKVTIGQKFSKKSAAETENEREMDKSGQSLSVTNNSSDHSLMSVVNGYMTTNNSQEKKKIEVNKYRTIGKYIDIVSFVVFMVIWILVTVGFMLDITSVTNV